MPTQLYLSSVPKILPKVSAQGAQKCGKQEGAGWDGRESYHHLQSEYAGFVVFKAYVTMGSTAYTLLRDTFLDFLWIPKHTMLKSLLR